MIIQFTLKKKSPIESIIGRPNANTQMYILDRNKKLCPVGVVGELYISGPQVAQGYLNQPELTAKTFIPDPFREGARIYKTGDLGKWLSDGTIVFQGRRDKQVKIHGYRIELEEIEHALLEQSNIDAAVVLAKPEVNETKQLVGYVVSKVVLNTSDLRAALSKRLPMYMLPSAFVQLDALPLTPNGKIDRSSLFSLENSVMGTSLESLMPRNEVEEKILKIWKEVLGNQKIGVTDNFFDVGGNSIKILKMVRLLNRTLDVKIPVVKIYEYANIAALAKYVNKNEKTELIKIDAEINASIDVMHETLNVVNRLDYEK